MGVTFTPAGAQKIKRAVQFVENLRKERGGKRTPTQNTDTFFWAMVLGPADVSAKHFYFVRITPDASPDRVEFTLDNGLAYRIVTEDVEPALAREANGQQAVPPLTVVLMSFQGYDADGEAAFIFQFVAAAQTLGSSHLTIIATT